MSGSNAICISTVLLDAGLIPMQEPVTHLILEAPGGLVRVRAECHDGKARKIHVRNVPSFAAEAANTQLGFRHPENPDWRQISFCLFAGPLTDGANGLKTRSAVAVRPGKVGRSPTGTALFARMAVLHARGQMKVGDKLVAHSLIRSTFSGTILGATKLDDLHAIHPEI